MTIESRPNIPLTGERAKVPPTIEMEQPLYPPYAQSFSVPEHLKLQPKREFMLVLPHTIKFYNDLSASLSRVMGKVKAKDLRILLLSSDLGVPEKLKVEIQTMDLTDATLTYTVSVDDNSAMFRRLEKDLLRFNEE